MNQRYVVDIEFLRSLMKFKNITEQEFSATIGISYSMVNRVMNGKRSAGHKFINGVLMNYKEVTYSQLMKCVNPLPKGNKIDKKPA